MKLVSKEKYDEAMKIVRKYRWQQKSLKQHKGDSTCPMCKGRGKSDYLNHKGDTSCLFCNKTGRVSNRTLVVKGMRDCIEKEKKNGRSKKNTATI